MHFSVWFSSADAGHETDQRDGPGYCYAAFAPYASSESWFSLKRLSNRARVGAMVMLGALGIGGLAALAVLNPTVAITSAPRTPSELLDDPSFRAPVNGPWQPTSSASTFGLLDDNGGKTKFGIISGTVRQNVALTPVNGRSYRFSVAVGSALATKKSVRVRGLLRLQTACASGEERAETSFDTVLVWKDGALETTEAAVTLTPKVSKDCSMRVEIVSSGADRLLVERASLVDPLLADPSFESGAPEWKLTKGTDGAMFTTRPDASASDGGAIGVLSAGASAVSIVQDLPLDLSSEAVLGNFEINARSASAVPVDIAVRAYEPCGTKVTEFKSSVGSSWTSLGVRQQRIPGTKGQHPPNPKDLIRPFGPACVFRVEVAILTPGATVELDSALLDLRTYNSPGGSPRYQAELKGYVEAETQVNQQLAQDAEVRQAELPSARRNP